MNKINPYPITCDLCNLKKTDKILYKEHFKKNINDEKLKYIDMNEQKKSTDIIKCNICDKSYTRSNKTKHNKTKHHIFCEKLNKKWRESILN